MMQDSLSNLEFFSIFNAERRQDTLALQDTSLQAMFPQDAILCDFTVGIDKRVYLLFKQPNAQSRMVQATDMPHWLTTPTQYTVVEIKIDWHNHQRKEVSIFPLGLLNFTFNFVRPIGNNFLLLGSRSVYQDSKSQNNAWVVSRTGKVLHQFCLGDGILNCVVNKDNAIITGYFDEGVYGNLGWEQPLGASGLNVWSEQGELLWSNQKYPIDTLRALNIDNQGLLWFYYHNDCQVICSDLRGLLQDKAIAHYNDLVFDTPDDGMMVFAIGSFGQNFLLQGEGDCQDKMYLCQRQDSNLIITKLVVPVFNGQNIKVQQCHVLSNMVLIQTDTGDILGTKI